MGVVEDDRAGLFEQVVLAAPQPSRRFKLDRTGQCILARPDQPADEHLLLGLGPGEKHEIERGDPLDKGISAVAKAVRRVDQLRPLDPLLAGHRERVFNRDERVEPVERRTIVAQHSVLELAQIFGAAEQFRRRRLD